MSLVLGHINLMSRILLHTNTVTQTKSEPESGVNILLHTGTQSTRQETSGFEDREHFGFYKNRCYKKKYLQYNILC